MGKTTKYFKQSNKSLSGNQGARNYSQVVRAEGWHIRVINYLKSRGKAGPKI